MSRSETPRRVDRAARYGPVVVLAFCLVMGVVLGVLPIWQYVSNHWPGVPVQQASVTRCVNSHVRNQVCATTEDGKQLAFIYEGHVLSPRTGSHIAVFEKNGQWHARDERALPFWAPVLLVLFGLGALACIITLLRRLRTTLRRHRQP